MTLALVGASSFAVGGCSRSDPERAPVVVGAAERGDDFKAVRSPPLADKAEPADTLSVRRVIGDSLSFARVVKLYHRSGLLLALDDLLSYHLVTVDLNDGSVRHFGRDGDGPREFRAPYSASFVFGPESQVWIYDFGLNRFSLLDLSGSEPTLKRTRPGPGGVRLLDPALGDGLISNALSADAVLAVEPGDRSGPLRLIDTGTPFDPAEHSSPLARRMLSRTFMIPSPDRERVAIVYQFTNRMEIVNRDGRHLTSVTGPRRGNASYRVHANRFFWSDDNISLYTGVTASDRHIYALFCGCRFDAEQATTRVHVFDWDGNFVREFAFDRRVGSIAAARDDSALFGFIEEPYPSIAEWEIPSVLLHPRT